MGTTTSKPVKIITPNPIPSPQNQEKFSRLRADDSIATDKFKHGSLGEFIARIEQGDQLGIFWPNQETKSMLSDFSGAIAEGGGMRLPAQAGAALNLAMLRTRYPSATARSNDSPEIKTLAQQILQAAIKKGAADSLMLQAAIWLRDDASVRSIIKRNPATINKDLIIPHASLFAATASVSFTQERSEVLMNPRKFPQHATPLQFSLVTEPKDCSDSITKILLENGANPLKDIDLITKIKVDTWGMTENNYDHLTTEGLARRFSSSQTQKLVMGYTLRAARGEQIDLRKVANDQPPTLPLAEAVAMHPITDNATSVQAVAVAEEITAENHEEES